MHGRKEKGRGEGASAAGFTKSEGGIHTLFSQKDAKIGPDSRVRFSGRIFYLLGIVRERRSRERGEKKTDII